MDEDFVGNRALYIRSLADKPDPFTYEKRAGRQSESPVVDTAKLPSKQTLQSVRDAPDRNSRFIANSVICEPAGSLMAKARSIEPSKAGLLLRPNETPTTLHVANAVRTHSPSGKLSRANTT